MSRPLTAPPGRPIPLALALGLATAIPIASALVRLGQIPAGIVPEGSPHLAAAPLTLFVHAAAGSAFGLIGPAQLLRRRGGAGHRVAGRAFALAGVGLAVSTLALLAQVQSPATWPLVLARLAGALALLGALAMGIATIRRGDVRGHRAWMILSYAMGMAPGTLALVFFPIFVITGHPPQGPGADLVFVLWWALMLALTEVYLHRPVGARR